MIVGMSALISLEIQRAGQEVGGTTDTKEDLAFVTLQSKQCINSWKLHLLRSTNQDESKLDVIVELDEKRAKQTGLVREICHGILRLQRKREMMARLR